MELHQMMEEMKKNRIRLKIAGHANQGIGVTKFGGTPDVPKDFEWPYYFGTSLLDDVEKNRPLSFLAQINCAELAKFDEDGILPNTGLLSFFYEEATAKWGYDPEDKGSARVYYFEDINGLVKAAFPEDLEVDYRNPEIGITMKTELSYPEPQDLDLKYHLTNEQEEEYVQHYLQDGTCCHQLLGWPGIIQNNMTTECELVRKGYYLGNTWEDIPQEDIEQAKQTSLDKWQLLFQLDEVEQDDFYLSFGDCGRLYFYITKEDLKNRKFENVWLVYQCF